MPRSSRSKSHKQSKHSSKEAAAASTAREYSGSDEDVKTKERSSNGGKEDGVSFRISKDSSVAGERRKHGKDLFSSHGNGDVSEEYTTSSKRREEKSHGGSDRWNGGSSDEKGVVVNIENKEVSKSKDFSKVVSESKSKSSRRHDAESASIVVLEKDEGKSGSGNRGEKRKSEKESARKESSQHKENKESKDKERGSDRGRKAHPDKLEADASSKQVENQSSKRGKESTEWPIEEGLRNPELEKELEKRMRRRGEASSEKDKYQDDMKEADDRRLSVKRHKDEGHGEDGVRESRQRDEKHREDGERDRKNRDMKHRGESERHSKHREDGERDRKNRDMKHRGESERHSKHRDDKDKHREDKYNEDGHRDTKYKDDKYIETNDKEERSRDGKRKQDDEREYRHKEDKHRDVKHRDDTDREKRSRDSKYKDTHSSKDHSIEPEPKRMKDDSVYDDRVSRYKDDKDRRRSNNDKEDGSEYRSRSMKEQRSESEKRSGTKVDSGSERVRPGSRYADMEVSGSHSRRRSSPSRDHHRLSKQEESKHRDNLYEDRPRHNRDFTSDKLSSRSTEKVNAKDDSYTQMDKSPSSRRSLEEEPGQRSGGSKDAKEHQHNNNLKDTHPDNDYSQVDQDNLSVSSPYTRNSHFRAGSDSPFFGSTEDDRNNKSNNRHRRMMGGGGGGGGESNMNRGGGGGGQGNWKNVPNWGSPMTPGGYMPFQHVPPPMFHPIMQQYPPPIFGRPPMKLNPGLPYHVPDHGRPLSWRDDSVPPPIHGWDGNNSVFGDESHYWDRRNQMSNRGEMWKVQSAMEVSQKPSEETWSGVQGVESEPSQIDVQTAVAAPHESEKVSESIQTFEAVTEDNDNDNETVVSQVYLSRVDVSEGLTDPAIYEQCTSMLGVYQEALSDEFDCKILFLEEGVQNVTDYSSSLFGATNDSVFQKAMFVYKKEKEEFDLVKGEKIVEKVDVNEEGNEAKKAMEVNDDDDDVVVKQEVEEERELTMAEPALTMEEKDESCKVEKEDESGELCDVGESIEFGSKVNLSRIHHNSPEKSTH